MINGSMGSAINDFVLGVTAAIERIRTDRLRLYTNTIVNSHIIPSSRYY